MSKALSRSPKKKDESESKEWVFVALILLGLFMLGYALMRDEGQTNHSGKTMASRGQKPVHRKAEPTEQYINSQLQVTERAMQEAQKSVELDNELAGKPNPEENPFLVGRGKNQDYGVSFDQDDRIREVYKDIRDPSVKYEVETSPEDRIQAQLALKKWLAEYDQQYRQQMKNVFIENARQAGYEVEVNENLIVTSIRRIPGMKQQPLRFPNNVESDGQERTEDGGFQ